MQHGGRPIAATRRAQSPHFVLQSLDLELQRQMIVVVDHGRRFDVLRRAPQRLGLRESGHQDGAFFAVEHGAHDHVARKAEQFRLMLLQGGRRLRAGKLGKRDGQVRGE